MLWIAVFFANASVMIFEVIGARAMTPYVGGSVETWSGIIAAILGGMSLGYWLGGRLADSQPHRRWLSYSLVLAGASTIFVWSLKGVFFPLAQTLAGSMPLSLATFLIGVIFFGPTSCFLGAVNPFVAKAIVNDLQASARSVGKLSAVAAIGSVLGTIIAGAWLVPSFGSNAIIYSIGVILLVLGLSCYGIAAVKKRAAIIVVGIVLLSSSAYVSATHADGHYEDVLADVDTRYARVWVFEEMRGNRKTRLMRTDPYSTQCASYINDDGSISDEPVFEYIRDMNVGIEILPDADTIAIAGGCNYSLPRTLHEDIPSAAIDVIEIDPSMTDIAREWFGLADEPGFDIIHEDARAYFNNHSADASERYDIVYLDAYNSFASIPFQLTTKEALEAIESTLMPDGVVVANTIGAIEGKRADFIRAFTATMQSVFPHVQAFGTREGNFPDNTQNIIMVASNEPFELPEEYAKTLLPIDTEEVAILTDDYAPIESLTAAGRTRAFGR
jgi:spermidine synthase